MAPTPWGTGAPLTTEEADMNPQKLSLYAELNHRDLVAKVAAHNLAARAAGDRRRRQNSTARTLGAVGAGARWILASVAALTLNRAL
jgi:hypothetical protein